MAKLGMTEPEILHASFASEHIVHKIREDYETGLASQLLFAYSNEKKRNSRSLPSNQFRATHISGEGLR